MPPQKNQIILICLFLSITTLIAFWQLKDNDFVNYDDYKYIVDNPHVKEGFDASTVAWAFTNYHVGHWHPLTWLSFILDYKLYGLNPSGYHLTNLFLHVINTLLLFLLFTGMTQAVWQSAAVAALFAIHPLHVESVAWVVERKDVLSTLFFILAMISYAGYVKRQKVQLYIVTLLLFIFGLMCKPMLVTLPFVLLLLDYWPLRRFKLGSSDKVAPSAELTSGKQSSKKKKTKKQTVEVTVNYSSLPHLVKEKIPFFILSALSSLITVLAARHTMSDFELMPLGTRISNAVVSYVIYMWKMVWPQNLAVLYPYTDVLPLWEVLLAGLLLLCITGVAVHYMKQAPYLIVGWLWFLGTLVPVIGLLQVGIQAYADRYTYIPLIGLFMILAWGIADISTNWRYRKIILISACSLIFLSLLVQARIQVGYWQNSITLFEHAVRAVDNNYLAHNNLGVALSDAGMYENAVKHYSEAIRIKPDYENAHFNLAHRLSSQGRTEEAIEHYSAAVYIRPDFTNAHNELGKLLASRGNFREAIFHYKEALKKDPADAVTYYNLGIALMAMQHYEEAVRQILEATRMNPEFVEAHNDLGIALVHLGKTSEAIEHFRKAVSLKPDYMAARDNLQKATELQQRLR